MLVRERKPWEALGDEATSEAVYRDRRTILRALGFGVMALGLPKSARAEPASGGETLTVPRNKAYVLDRPITDEHLATRHNIFDEFSLEREKVWQIAEGFETSPWPVHIGGAIEKTLQLDVEEMIRRFGLEERLYRHRCVETWAMAVPWIGFPLRKLVEFAKPLPQARYLRMISFSDPKAPGWYASRRVFPYYEGLRLDEANHDLAFLATGLYGKSLPPQNGAPLRLVVPWKYGYKSIKSIVAFQFTREEPGTFWSELAPHLYGFESNVDPASNHPWPQALETPLGTEEKRETLPYNGYAQHVAELYA